MANVKEGRYAVADVHMTPDRPRLRDLNKRRTRETIIFTAIDLFSERGYKTTTLAQIAAAAGVAPSTLHSYFAEKSDIVFGLFDEVVEGARTVLLPSRSTASAEEMLTEWFLGELATTLDRYGVERIVRIHEVVQSNATLARLNRLRDADIQDVLRNLFSSKSGEPANSVHVTLIATLVANAMWDSWFVWYRASATLGQQPIQRLAIETDANVKRILKESAAGLATLANVTYSQKPIA